MNQTTYNTKSKGVLHYIVYKKDGEFTAVCLNLNIVEYGKDPEKLRKSVQEAAMSYVNAIRKKNLSDDYLNQIPDKKYIEKLKEIRFANELMEKSSGKPITISRAQVKAPSYFDLKSRPYTGANFANA